MGGTTGRVVGVATDGRVGRAFILQGVGGAFGGHGMGGVASREMGRASRIC